MKKITYTLNVLFGILLGFVITYFSIKILGIYNVVDVNEVAGTIGVIAIYAVVCALFSVVFLVLSDKMAAGFKKIAEFLEGLFSNVSTSDLLLGVIGLIVGLLIASLLTVLFNGIPWQTIRLTLSAFTYIILGYLGVAITTRRKSDLSAIFKRLEKVEKKKDKYPGAKILDTSVVIDGRVLEIMRSGFLEGTIIVSDLILNELRHIADCSDVSKRTRGRRGLDLLKIMQDEFDKRVMVINVGSKYKDVEEVDEKLLLLTNDLKGKIITNDYNLNMMATVQKIPVLNINELAGCLKPNVMSGEVIEVEVVKQGKEDGQGVAFLDDGTMIVIENGRRYIGNYINIEITSIIQTASGRMIFAIVA